MSQIICVIVTLFVTTSAAYMQAYKLPGSTSPIVPFYDAQQPLFELTNFAKTPVRIDGVLYPTTEHYFQAQKFEPAQRRNAFLKLVESRGNGPRHALEVAREWTNAWTKQQWQAWDQRKENVMEFALRQKLTQHPHIAQKLRATMNSCLVEDTAPSNEKYWGWGTDGLGKNRLGILWMKIRNDLFRADNLHHLIVDPEREYLRVQNERVLLGIPPSKSLLQHWVWAGVTPVHLNASLPMPKNTTKAKKPESNKEFFTLALAIKLTFLSLMVASYFLFPSIRLGVALFSFVSIPPLFLWNNSKPTSISAPSSHVTSNNGVSTTPAPSSSSLLFGFKPTNDTTNNRFDADKNGGISSSESAKAFPRP